MAKEVVPNPELRKIGLEFYKGPFRFDHLGGYIWAKGDPSTHGSQMFADLDQAGERCARIRGWGALQYLKGVDCGALQDEIGVMFAEAITEYWDRAKNTLVVVLPAPGTKTPELLQLLTYLDQHHQNEYNIDVEGEMKGGWENNTPTTFAPDIDVAVPRCHVQRYWKFWLHSQGIEASLREGDIITLQQGRFLITRAGTPVQQN
jgi:hypothetical protein